MDLLELFCVACRSTVCNLMAVQKYRVSCCTINAVYWMLREGVFVTSVGTQSAVQMFVLADHLLIRVVHCSYGNIIAVLCEHDCCL